MEQTTGDKAHRLPAAWGLALAAVTLVFHALIGRQAGIEAAAILLAMIAAVYVGFAISEGNRLAIGIEAAVALAFGCAALAGLLFSPWFIVGALAAHAFWDLLHHRQNALAATPRWYVPFCALYDLASAAGLACVWFA